MSFSNEGSGAVDCSCDGGEQASAGSSTHASHGDGHWDGTRAERERCMGESHGPQCGHEVKMGLLPNSLSADTSPVWIFSDHAAFFGVV